MKSFSNFGIAALVLALPLAALADINATIAVPVGATLNLDTGALGTTGGDILWNGSSINVQGNATSYGFPVSVLGSGPYGALTQATLSGLGPAYSTKPLSGVNVAPNWIIGVHTNGGNYAKILVVSQSSGSILLQYTTYGATAGGGGGGGGGGSNVPAITAVQNNYSYLLPGLPNYGIAPGSLFIVKGTNLNNQPLSSLQSSAGGLPASLNGSAISVTVNGTTVSPAIYYTSQAQLAAVLPSNTPVGTGTITVTNSGQPSPSAPIVVVPSALGLDTYYGTGTGLVTATDANYNVFSMTNSASPGQTIVLWGSGAGADTANDDRTYPLKQDNLTNVAMTVYFGGIAATPSYRGRSQFPGVDQVVVTIPSNVQTGCNISVVAVTGTISSNAVTLPIAQGNQMCSDPTSAASAGLISQLSGKSTVNVGLVSIDQGVQNVSAKPTTSYAASGIFYSYTGAAFAASQNSGSAPSLGSCVVTPQVVGATPSMPTGLDAGSITVTGPGTQVTLQGIPTTPGIYSGQVPTIPPGGASYTFAGAGGKNVGSFNTTLNFPAPLLWTNRSSITSVNRSAGQTVTWTGGAPGTFVYIGGQSTASSVTTPVLASFVCYAPVNAGTFTIPSWILQALPSSGNGSLSLTNETTPVSFTATGLDFAYGLAVSSNTITVSYQ